MSIFWLFFVVILWAVVLFLGFLLLGMLRALRNGGETGSDPLLRGSDPVSPPVS
jgi:hypothetical protein